jgi:hypothetical protein
MAIVVANSAGQLHQAQKAIAANEERIRKDKYQMVATPERSIAQQASNGADLLLHNSQVVFLFHKLSELSS